MSMGTLDGKTLRDALSKAKQVGIVEETFTIEDCELVLRNLRPDEYTAAMLDCRGLEDVEYLHAYQKAHIARAIVGINGVDFHGVEYIEDEEPDPKRPEKTRTIKVELHSYLLKHVVSTWSKEAVYTTYRKFGDVVSKAESKATQGITFLVPEETDEERYRRLLLEAKEVQEDIPSTLVDRILDELGLMRKSTADEIKAAMERTDQLAREQEQASPEPEPEPQAAAASIAIPQPEAPRPTPQRPIPADPHQTLQQAIAARRQGPVAQPATPVVQSAQTTATPAVDAAVASSQPFAQHGIPPAQVETSSAGRSAKIAALEAEVSLPETLPGSHGPIPVLQQTAGPVEITQKQDPFDPRAASSILNQPPAGGLNPRFRPPQRA